MPDIEPDVAVSTPAAHSRLIRDVELAPMIGVSISYLQRDRREGQRIPFYKIGDRCLYDPAVVFNAIRQYEVGGPQARRGRRAAR